MQSYDLSIDYQTRKVFDLLVDAERTSHDTHHFGEPTTMADVARQIAREERELQHYLKVAEYQRTHSF